jgi:all-trans-retinol 13,14-reductase
MYGISMDYKSPMATYVAPRTKIPNLFFTGQNVSLHGMLGVSMSSLVTCGELLGLNNLIKEINEA